MTLSHRVIALFTGLLLTTSGYAQTPLGQPTLDEQKVQIWCATVRYVYDDNNRPNLKSSLNCGGSLADFVTSIKADSQKVYSMLYQPLEGKGTMYKGLGSDKSRLQKLTTEIVTKLQASPARRADAARMAKLTTLKEQLDAYLTNGTPPADLNSDVTAAGADTEDTSVADEASLAASDAGVGQGAAEGNAIAPRPAAASESLMSKLFAPLALILSLLSIFLYVMLRRSISALGTRADRHRSELESVKAAALSGSAPSAGVVAAAAAPKRITPELQREIERMVQQRVAEELAKHQSSATAAPKVEAPAPRQAPPVAQAANRAANTPARPAAPAPKPAPAPTPPVQNQFQNIASAPTTHAPPQVPMHETAPVPQPIPSGSPASAPRDDFDSLVPPVQLPGPETWETPAPVAAAPAASTPTRYYVKVPVNGGFSEYDLQEQPQHDSIYEITPDPRVPERATFRVTANTGVHAYAIQSAQYSLREACAYQQPNGPVSRIVTDKDGTLIKSNGAWQIEQKAVIHFE
ncbi:hypothetical protein [Hymenobacter metallicola]|uniref:Uncharacterized protein n=1 Tax=Hymenobacter metallicola TaxID=2563114 RepID=A0A4Z0QCD8_9BACT|nr:hypothetical protein [Hymenobacter metallicola]TGE26372.1 hypothetical protein E5K02_16375 [Hymenobacter metallicola]